MEKFGERVAAARKHKGWSQGRLAREIGISQPSVFQMEHGDSNNSKHSFKIAEKTGVRIEWLVNATGPMVADATNAPPHPAAQEDPMPFRPPETETLNIQQFPMTVRVLGGALCSQNGNDEDGLFELNGQILDHVRRPPRLLGVTDAYALYTLNDCMFPWRAHGDLVYVHPGQPVKQGDYVVVQLKPEGDGTAPRAYIKRLVRRTATNIILHQYNPAKDITIPTKKIHSIHRIMDWSELMGL